MNLSNKNVVNNTQKKRFELPTASYFQVIHIRIVIPKDAANAKHVTF